MKNPKSFEEGAARLEELLARIGDENTPLTQAVKLYAEAADLLAYCTQTLDQARLQIEEIDARMAPVLQKSETEGADDDIEKL